MLNIGDESLLVSRTEEGELAAFYNVCQHRGARIMVNERGWVRDFVCPYHGWTYDHAGTLTVVPDADRFTPPVDQTTTLMTPPWLLSRRARDTATPPSVGHPRTAAAAEVAGRPGCALSPRRW